VGPLTTSGNFFKQFGQEINALNVCCSRGERSLIVAASHMNPVIYDLVKGSITAVLWRSVQIFN